MNKELSQLEVFQQKLFRKFENDKDIITMSSLRKAIIMPIVYRFIGRAYRKGFKRGKTVVIETINNIKL